MRKILSTIFPLSDFLYLLQLEGYETERYFARLKRFFWKRDFQKRGGVVYTRRVKITLAFSLPASIVFFPLTPVWIGFSNLILSPYFEWVKAEIQNRAKEKFSKLGVNTQVVMIAGSYGKTTTKNYIYELVRYNYKTQMIPGNINTLTGIANWINESFDGSTQILVAEVDPYYVGEIKKVASIIPPDIAILTVVGDQHLERLGSRANLKKALMEVFENAKPGAHKIRGKKTNLDYALEVAKILKIPKDIVRDTVKKLKTPPRRRSITRMNGYEVIDDSYNISETTAKAGIDYARKFSRKEHKKLIVITAGIPELGEENKEANQNLGKYLDKKADKVIVLESVFHEEIIADFKNKDKKVYLAENLVEAWNTLRQFGPRKHLVLLQPELNDLYY